MRMNQTVVQSLHLETRECKRVNATNSPSLLIIETFLTPSFIAKIAELNIKCVTCSQDI